MAKFDGKRWWNNQRIYVEKKLLEPVTITYPNGKEFHTYDFMSGKPKELFDDIFKQLLDQGIDKATAIRNMKSRTQLIGADAEDEVKGKIAMPLHHFLDIMDSMDFTVMVELKNPFEHHMEADRIILTRTHSPYIQLNINSEDIYDFEITLLEKDRSVQRKYGLGRIINMTIMAYEHYFKKENPKAVINKTKIREAVTGKWYREEVQYISKAYLTKYKSKNL